MSITTISDYSRTASLVSGLQSEQLKLTELSVQLSTEKKYTNLTDYSAAEARNLINMQATATQKQAYLSVISTANTTLSVYDSTLTDLESVVEQAKTLANNSSTYSETTSSNLYIQANNFLKSVTVDLNQDLNGRYLYSGTRYSQRPVEDLASLSEATLTTTIYTDDLTLPSYDTDWVEETSQSTAAYAGDRAVIDTNYEINYGITSNEPAFQKLVAGLRYLQAAGNSSDSATYAANMENAKTLLSEALPALQTLHTTVANNINALEGEQKAINTALSNLTTQIADIQQVDITQVSAEITMLEALLQASYSATGSILKLSIVNFL
ncbi:MAG: flagellin [Alphaproteobacteria bacterium]|nr:flagellin [Alphaproteobacteria bacterium]